ncbi:MAG: DUF3788 domain-containing protein [Alphaproteobacteria bacterium]|nr:DUF3788 domain-containing protein [Alphaproteobacteria bacterium]MCL2890051.1 DUF3788 domain-containing protein [Alphaproteobacteria bacterium]
MFNKLNREIRPTKDDLIGIVKNKSALKKLITFIENDLGGAAQIDYSTCSMAPGWNLKYKRGARAICTIYPDKDYCGVMITLNRDALEQFDAMSELFSPAVRKLADEITPLNGAKWLTVDITAPGGFDDAKKMLILKFSK